MTGLEAPHRYRTVGLAVLLAAAYYVANPFWFGDATWYARDLAAGPSGLRLDAGHLLWRPLGYGVWRLLSAVGLGGDPLTSLRLLSSVATAVLCIATYRLAVRLSLGPSEAAAAAALVGTSKVCLAYGGSGSSYTLAMAMCVLAMIPLLSPRGEAWRIRDAVASALAFAAGWAAWGTSVLALPGLVLAAFVGSSGRYTRRLARAAIVGVASSLLVAVLAVSAYALAPAGSGSTSLGGWIASSSHGTPAKLSWMGGARAVYGLLVGFVHLGSVGTAVKNVLLGGGSGRGSALALLPLPVAAAFGVLLAVAFVGLVAEGRRPGARPCWTIAAIATAVSVPVAAFAVAWKGSDVERFSLAVPFVAVVVVHGLSSLVRRAKRATPRTAAAAFWGITVAVAVVNLASFVAPRLANGGGLTMGVGRVASQHLRPESLLVVAGNDLFVDVAAAASYFYEVQVDNVTYDVQVNGPGGFEERLRRQLDQALARGGEIAVLSDLLGRPTPDGIGLNEREHPKPSLEELVNFFASWRTGREWKVERFTFVEIRPPSGESDPPGDGVEDATRPN